MPLQKAVTLAKKEWELGYNRGASLKSTRFYGCEGGGGWRPTWQNGEPRWTGDQVLSSSAFIGYLFMEVGGGEGGQQNWNITSEKVIKEQAHFKEV